MLEIFYATGFLLALLAAWATCALIVDIVGWLNGNR